VAGTAGFLGFGSEAAQAQQAGKVPRVGVLIAGSRTAMSASVDSFRQGVRDRGYIEGKTITFEERYADGKLERLSDLASELLRLEVDVIVTAGTPGVQAVTKLTKTTPVVFVAVGDPVASGLIASLARPGGNVTGLSQLAPELSGKRLEILKEAFPKILRVAYLWTPDLPGSGLKGMEAAAPVLRLKLQPLAVRRPEDFERAFAAALKERAQGFTAATAPIINTHQKQILEFVAKSRLPAIYAQAEWVDAGGLMSYGPNAREQFRRAAVYVDKILKGEKPAELPVEQPMRFEFVVNLTAAKQIGLTVPPNVLVRADRVIR